MAKKKLEKKAEKKTAKKVEETSSDLYPKIIEEIDALLDDMKKYEEKGTAAAAKRARKCTSNLTHLFKSYRKATLTETKKED